MKFSVRRCIDAYVYERTIVEAETVTDAVTIAGSVHYVGDWVADGISSYDHVDIFDEDVLALGDDDEPPEPSKLFDLTETERYTIVNALKVFQVMPRFATTTSTKKILTDAEIDRLCEEFGV